MAPPRPTNQPKSQLASASDGAPPRKGPATQRGASQLNYSQGQAPICKVCAAELRLGSKFCTECSSYQNWLRIGLIWGGIAGAVVSVLSLVSGALSLAQIAFNTDATIDMVPLRCAEDEVDLAIENSGDRTALIREITVQASGFQSKTLWEGQKLWLQPATVESLLVPGQSTKVLHLVSVHKPVAGQKVPIIEAGRETDKTCIYTVTMKIKPPKGAANEQKIQQICECSH